MPVTRSKLQGVLLSVDYSILDAIDSLRYACGKLMAFGACERSTTDDSSTAPPLPDASSVLDVSSVIDDRLDQGSAEELTFMQQVAADDSGALMFPSIDFS
jgi:hypothetical protein